MEKIDIIKTIKNVEKKNSRFVGRYCEMLVIASLLAKGWEVFDQTTTSFFDLVAINKDGKTVRIEVCKFNGFDNAGVMTHPHNNKIRKAHKHGAEVAAVDLANSIIYFPLIESTPQEKKKSTCDQCEKDIIVSTANKRFCSVACREEHHRERKSSYPLTA